MFAACLAWFIHHSLLGGFFICLLFVKKPLCFSKPVKVLISVLTGLFKRWLPLGLWRCVRVCACISASVLFVYTYLPLHNCVCIDWGFCNEAYFGLWVVCFDWAAQQLHTEMLSRLICSHPQLIWDCLICFTDKLSVFVSCGIGLISSK